METNKTEGRISYNLSSNFIQDEIIKTGQEPKKLQTYKFNFEDLTPEIRKMVIEVCDKYHNYRYTINFTERIYEYAYTNTEEKSVEEFKVDIPAFDYEINDENFAQAIVVINDFYNEWYPKFLEYQEQKKVQQKLVHEKREAEENQRSELRKAENESRKIEEEKFNKIFNEEMIKWIKKNGSERLNKGIDENYNMRGAYVNERARVEFPDYYVDFKEKYEWLKNYLEKINSNANSNTPKTATSIPKIRSKR